jgi:hypothetical protein
MLASQGRSTQRHGIGGVGLHAVMNVAGKNGVAHHWRKQLRQ